jgi:hypothetical protein
MASAENETYGTLVNPEDLVSVEKPEIDDLVRIYPVPVRDYLHIDLPFEGSHQADAYIHDVHGRLMQTVNALSTFGGKMQLHVNTLKPGTYFLTIAVNRQILKGRFIKM